ncbi:MAG: SET domain-containing protein-lysine N-methyltransferase [Acidobacteria bacterium]|nr:SET domain-containing protein-lysine N-methyltransferase [Acidobacteriota bacterium]
MRSKRCEYWLTPKAERRESTTGTCSIYAVAQIAPNECLWDCQKNSVECSFDEASVNEIPDPLVYVYLSCPELGGDCFQHSCDPNAGFRRATELVAMRSILPGEQITFDLAMCLPFHFGAWDCHCGTWCCRQRVTGSDWEMHALQQRYQGYFQPYIEAKIRRGQSV